MEERSKGEIEAAAQALARGETDVDGRVKEDLWTFCGVANVATKAATTQETQVRLQRALKALAVSPTVGPVNLYYQALLLDSLDRVKEADELYQKLVASDPDEATSTLDRAIRHFYRANALVLLKRGEEADEAYGKAIEILASRCRSGSESRREALQYLRLAKELGQIDWSLGRAVLDRQIRQNPSDADLWWEKAEFHLKEERLAEAEDAARKAHELDPEDHSLLLTLASIAEARGDAPGAAGLYRAYVQAVPDDKEGYWGLYDNLSKTRPTEALTAMKEGLRQIPQEFLFLIKAALLCEKLADREGAKALWQRAGGIEGAKEIAEKHLAELAGMAWSLPPPTNYWLVVSKPENYEPLGKDLEDYAWSAAREMRPGDVALYYKARKPQEVGVIARVLGAPFHREDWGWGSGWVTHYTGAVRVEKPITRDELMRDSVLSQWRVLKHPQGVAFRIPPEHVRRFIELIRASNPTLGDLPFPVPTTTSEKAGRRMKPASTSPREEREARETVPAVRDEEIREHTEIQWRLIELGKNLGYDVWVANNDRGRAYDEHRFSDLTLGQLPLRLLEPDAESAIRRVDVIWFRGNVVQDAFEVESTTNIRDGMERMARLFEQVSGPGIGLHVVVPLDRVNEVKDAARRPLYSKELIRRFTYVTFEDLRSKEDGLRNGRIPLRQIAYPVL